MNQPQDEQSQQDSKEISANVLPSFCNFVAYAHVELIQFSLFCLVVATKCGIVKLFCVLDKEEYESKDMKDMKAICTSYLKTKRRGNAD